MITPANQEDARFREAVQGLIRGDFSALEPLFVATTAERPKILDWYDAGYFREEPAALDEALSCACFNGRTEVADYLLGRGVDPAHGAGTGMNAFHWAVNRGKFDAVRLLLRYNAPLEARNMYGGTVLGAVVWAALHESKPDHLAIMEVLLAAGARTEEAGYPTGNQAIDALLRRHNAK